MSLGIREERRRRSRQFRWTVLKWAFALFLIIAAGVYAYQTGAQLAETEVARLKAEIETLRTTVTNLETQSAEQTNAIAAEKARAEEWRQRYSDDVPAGELRDLYEQVKAKLSEGVDVERLRFVIAAAENERNCDPSPTVKRFIVQTPLYSGADDAVRFANGAITVTATGEPARNDSGQPEAWFDPAKPLDVAVTQIGGKRHQFSGTLPLHPSVVVGGDEYQLTIVASSRGFVQVSERRCDYP